MLDSTFGARVGQTLELQVQRQALLTNFNVAVVQRPTRLPSAASSPAASND